MVSATLLAVAVAQAGCVYWLYAGAAREFRRWWPLALVGVGLAYDSIVFGVGSALGESPLLRTLSVGRYVGHVVLTPLLLIWVAPRLLRWRPRWTWSLATALCVWGAAFDLMDLSLRPREFADTLRYVPAASHGPPLPALLVTAILLAAGIAWWRKGNGPWLALGSVLMVAASGAAVLIPPLGNAGEAALLAACVAVELETLRTDSSGIRATEPT